MHCFNTESSNWMGEGRANVHVLSVPDDIPVVGNAAAMLEGFKNNKEKLDQPTFLDSLEQFNDKENDAKHPVLLNILCQMRIFNSYSPVILSGGTVASSDLYDIEASHELDRGSSKTMVKEVPVEDDANASQIEIKITENQSSDDRTPPTDAVMPRMAKSFVGSPERQESYDNYESLQMNLLESDTNVGPDANSLSNTGVNQITHLVGLDDEKDDKCDLSWDHSSEGPIEKNLVDDGDHETEKYAIAGDDYIEVSTEKIVAENPTTSLENASCLSKHKVNPTNLHNGDDSGDHNKEETEKSDICGNESRGGSVEENLLAKPKLNLDSISNSSRADLNVISDTQESVMESEVDCNDKVQLEVEGSTAAGSDHGPKVESSEKSLEDCAMKEVGRSSSNAESSVLSFNAAEESDKNFVRQQLNSSALDVVDSNNQTDSLESNWGSVSVLSIQSDAQAVIDAKAVAPTDSQASLEEKSKAATQDKSDMFEASSFMTLVEPGGVDNQKATAAEIQTGQSPEQPKPAPLQAGWFPSITHVVNESQGRKENEEIIANVTNWSTGKQHTPLKNLLGEACLENKAKSPNQEESQAPMLQKEDKAVKGKDSGRVTTTVNSILAPESPTGQAPGKENAKEWNSPARFPSEIKSEKRKAKGRPYWAQFFMLLICALASIVSRFRNFECEALCW